MPFTVQNLIEGRQPPLIISPSESAQKALELMIEYDYSQLPVIDSEGVLLGMITSDSIVRALNNFDVTTKELRVADAIIKTPKYRADDDLFELLNGLRDNYAVIIIDGDSRLMGIVTSYDTTEFFRRRAEDIMLVEDIETTLKDMVLASFTDEKGEVDQVAVSTAIEEIVNSKSSEMGKFKQALLHYLRLIGDNDPKVKSEWVKEAFLLLHEKKASKSFHELNLNDYIALLLHKSRWPHYSPIFNLDPDAIRRMLNEVRETRNALAHFHGEVSTRRRALLRFCAEWLARYQPSLQVAFAKNETAFDQQSSDTPTASDPGQVDEPADKITTQADETFSTGESRYTPLAQWLQSRPSNQEKAFLTFKQIEEIINDNLPDFARQHRAWWSNEAVGYAQSQQWLGAGWRVSIINMAAEEVTFVRIREWEKAYAEFFSSLLGDLNDATQFQIENAAPDGSSWVVSKVLAEDGSQIAAFAFSFTTSDRFRVELYIETGDKEKNKLIFNELQTRKKDIEEALEEKLSWERINYNRAFGQAYQPASRIAIYHDGSITDSEDKQSKLRTWAVETMVSFHHVLAPLVLEVISCLR